MRHTYTVRVNIHFVESHAPRVVFVKYNLDTHTVQDREYQGTNTRVARVISNVNREVDTVTPIVEGAIVSYHTV
jgi:hypothetical protein